jgi:gamma-glutamyltranspeptidase/glutathione hydrolase
MNRLLAFLVSLAGCAWSQPVAGRNGMVSSAHPLASEAGIEILRSGGNAFDAAVAVASTLNVAEPQNSGAGGYGLILIYDATKRKVRALNASGRIPKGVDPEAFRDAANRRGAKTIAPPVNARAWEQLSKTYGRLAWKKLFGRAIELAEGGFPLPAAIPAALYARFPAHAQQIYGKGGKPLGAGETLIQKDLAKSLRLIASQGPDVLHGGALGRTIAAELARAGSFVTLEDIAASRPEWWDGISIRYRDYEVFTAPPPANSFTGLMRLGLLVQTDFAKMGAETPDFWHLLAEVTKHGEWSRLRYAGDPDIAPPPLQRLLSPAYFQEQARKLDKAHASEFTPPGVTATESENTTHFTVADRFGNVVSMTQTIGNSFGSLIMAPGTGIWLNDSLSYSTFEPRGNPMDVHPGRRKLNSNTPVFVMKQGRPWIALGAAGGHTIPQTVPFTLVQMIDLGKDIAAALAAPRISFVADQKVLAVESRLKESIRQNLAARGHKLQLRDIGRLHGLSIEYDARGRVSRFEGAHDPRGSGAAKGY